MTQWVGYDKDCAVVSCDFCVIPAANACWRHCRLSWHEAALTRHNQKTPMASQSASDYNIICIDWEGLRDGLHATLDTRKKWAKNISHAIRLNRNLPKPTQTTTQKRKQSTSDSGEEGKSPKRAWKKERGSYQSIVDTHKMGRGLGGDAVLHIVAGPRT